MFNKIPPQSPNLKHTSLPITEGTPGKLTSTTVGTNTTPLAQQTPSREAPSSKSIFSRTVAPSHVLHLAVEENLDAELGDSPTEDNSFSIEAHLQNQNAPLLGLGWMGEDEIPTTASSAAPVLDLSNMSKELKIFPEIEKFKDTAHQNFETQAIDVSENEGMLPPASH